MCRCIDVINFLNWTLIWSYSSTLAPSYLKVMNMLNYSHPTTKVPNYPIFIVFKQTIFNHLFVFWDMCLYRNKYDFFKLSILPECGQLYIVQTQITILTKTHNTNEAMWGDLITSFSPSQFVPSYLGSHEHV